MNYLAYLYYNLKVHLAFINVENWKAQHVIEWSKASRDNGGNALPLLKLTLKTKQKNSEV